MKKVYRVIFYIMIIVMLIVLFVPNQSFADNTTSDSGLGDLNQYRGTTIKSSKLEHIEGIIFSAIQMVGSVLSVIILVIIGIKYMLGSVEEKADYKKTLVPYLIGALLLFTGTLIPQLIYTLVKENF